MNPLRIQYAYQKDQKILQGQIASRHRRFDRSPVRLFVQYHVLPVVADSASLAVPVASRGGRDIFEFDIHEKHHGVNGIVAGMPGSGKTEMVQSWLLSLAVNYSPQDLSFVLIDFKGTGMIAPFRDIPHLAGAISNLDTNIDRNLQAIQSEVHRREAIIDKYSAKSVKNINDLNKAYSKGLVPEKLPILLIVIDEYAEFKKVFPDFGAEIDSLTSKGRALGMFVILMTQKPAGRLPLVQMEP